MAFNTSKRTDVSEYGNYSEPTTDSKSFLGKTMRIEGEIISDEDLTIEGTVNGQLKINKTLTIGEEGHVFGQITASIVRISGEVEGEITASKKLEISTDGKFSGNIKAETIVVSEGAQLKGSINLEELNIANSVKSEIEIEAQEDIESQENTEAQEDIESQENIEAQEDFESSKDIDPSDTTEIPAVNLSAKHKS